MQAIKHEHPDMSRDQQLVLFRETRAEMRELSDEQLDEMVDDIDELVVQN